MEVRVSAVAIVGAGFMGSAMAWPLSDRGHEVRLIGTPLDEEIIASCKGSRWHPKLRRTLPESARPFSIAELDEALKGVELIVQGVSSAGVEWIGRTLGPRLDGNVPLLAITKGLTLDGRGDLQILPDFLDGLLPGPLRGRMPLAAVGGPCIAGELAGRRQTCVFFAGRDQALLTRLADMLRTDYYHIWTSTDLRGVETCAALKNAYVLGIGLATGLLEAAGGADEAGANMFNLAAALFAEASREMIRLVELMGGNPALVYSLPGVGDMFVTAQGGRTLTIGALLGRGLRIDAALRELAGVTLESVEAIRVVNRALPKLEREGKIGSDELPLMRHLGEIVAGGPVRIPLDRFFGGNSRPR
jgi:glycerol-3-phosphate dehydrogenase (NAD(P)+)